MRAITKRIAAAIPMTDAIWAAQPNTVSFDDASQPFIFLQHSHTLSAARQIVSGRKIQKFSSPMVSIVATSETATTTVQNQLMHP